MGRKLETLGIQCSITDEMLYRSGLNEHRILNDVKERLKRELIEEMDKRRLFEISFDESEFGLTIIRLRATVGVPEIKEDLEWFKIK